MVLGNRKPRTGKPQARGIMETYDAQPRGWEEGPDLLQSVWRYKWLIAVAALLGALLGYGWASRQPTIYEAAAEVVLRGTASPPAGEGQPQPIGDPERYIQNQATLIGTTPVLELAVKKIKGGRTSVDDLRQRMDVEVGQDSDVITVGIAHENASGAAILANAIAEAYKDFIEGQPRQVAAQLRANRTKLETRLAQVNEGLRAEPDNTSLRRDRDALERQLTQIANSLAATQASVGTDLVLVEPAVPPGQPAQPAPRRTAAVGLLVGLLVSVALAWLLNSRRTAQDARTEWERSGPPEALPARGHELAPENQGWSVAPESFVLASRRPDTVVTKNGMRGHSAIGRLMWRFRDRRNLNEPSSNLNEVAQEGAGAFHRVVDEKLSTRVSENGDETSLSSLFVRLDRTLAKEPLDFYSKNLPQATVEELYAEVSSDMVVILLDDGEGSFRVAGSIGLDPGEQDAIVDQDHEQLRQALWNGVSVLYGADALGAAAGIPGSQTLEGLLIMPLVQGRTWLGMLLIGRRGSQRQHAIPFSDQEIADALLCAMELSALIQALLLAKRLRECMGAFEP
jgi:capsular polysaccharide biosynthesis protein